MQFALTLLDRLHDGKERRPVLLELRPLMPALGVLDREVVEIELRFKRLDLAGIGIANGDPDKTPWPAKRSDLGGGDVADAVTLLVGDAADEHSAILWASLAPVDADHAWFPRGT
jgi:hypothetical protein